MCKTTFIVSEKDIKKYSWAPTGVKGGEPAMDWFFRCPKCPFVVIICATAHLDNCNGVVVGLLPGKVARSAPYAERPQKVQVQHVEDGEFQPVLNAK